MQQERGCNHGLGPMKLLIKQNGDNVMNKWNLIVAISLTSVLTACGTTWVSTDNSAVNNKQISTARVSCQIDEKLYQLRNKKITTNAIISQMPDAKSKKSWKDTYSQMEKNVHHEISECMKNEGFKKS